MGEYGHCIEDYDLHLDEVLGKGGFAKVYRARCRRSGLEVAIKMIDKNKMLGAGMRERVKQETRIHSILQHPSILKLYSYFEDSYYVYMVLELCHNGNLQNYLEMKGKLTEVEGCMLLRTVVEGLLYLHRKQIVHRDLSLANLLLTKDNDVKISDFGLATYTQPDKKHMTMCGTPNYISPEVATSSEHGPETDVWSLGIMLFTVLVGYPPFDHKDGVRSTLTRVVMSDLKIPDELSSEAKDLISHLLQKNPRERIRLDNVLFHKFFLKYQNRDISTTTTSASTSSRLEPNRRWLSYDSGFASSFQTSTLSVPTSHHDFTGSLLSGRLPIINGALRNHHSLSSQMQYEQPSGKSSSNSQSIHPCCNGHLPSNNRRDDCSHCNPSSEHRHICSSSSYHRCHQLPASVPSEPPSPAKLPIPPLCSQRLQPIRQKTKNVIVNILENGEVCLEFTKLKHGQELVHEVLRISPDGLRIVLYQPNRGKGVLANSSNPPPLPAGGADLIFSYENIPEKYWKKYSYAAKFVDLVKTKTPKVTFYSKSAKCFLMENVPDPDFEACFYEGGKITKSSSSVKLTESNGESVTFDATTNPHLSPSAQLMWEHFSKCLKHCKQIESTLCSLSEESDDVCFPVIIGRRPPEYPRALQLSSTGNKENLSPTAPSAVNVRTIGGYEGSVISASSKPGSGSLRRKKVIREYDVTNGGRVTQYSNGDINLRYADGSSLILNSTSPTVHYITQQGQVCQYKETDSIPSEIRTKLSHMSEIVKALMPSTAIK